MAYEGPSSECHQNKQTRSMRRRPPIGAIAGAALGSNLAVRGGRLGASIIGGVLGAGVGGAVGHHSVHCG